MGNWLAEVDEPPAETEVALRGATEVERPLVRKYAAWGPVGRDTRLVRPTTALTEIPIRVRFVARIWPVHTNVLPPSAVECVHPQGQDVVPPVERRTMVREGLQSDEGPSPAEPRPARERLDEEMREAGITAGDIVETIHDPLIVLTPDLRVQVVNPVFYEQFRASPEETTGRLIYELGNGQWDIPELHTLLEEILPENETFDGSRARERIFEPFQRGASGDAAGEGDHERKGLGLYIARRMAEAHGGALEVESSGEEGTMFSIRLPRNAANESSG